MIPLVHYFFLSAYRFSILGLVVAMSGLWIWWYRTDQLTSISPILYATCLVGINIVLAFFSYTRHKATTNYLFIFSYAIILLVAYNLSSILRGLSS